MFFKNQFPNLESQCDFRIVNLKSVVLKFANNAFCAFDKKRQRAILGLKTNFKILNLMGPLKYLRKISFPYMNPRVSCMVCNKNLNWLAAGNGRQIECWMEIENGEWISTLPKQLDKKHADKVNSLILNNNEDQLISSSADQTIMIWKVNCKFHQFEYDYILDNKHENEVWCLTLTDQDNYLISSSQTEIILWVKGQQNKWEFQNKIVNQKPEIYICIILNDTLDQLLTSYMRAKVYVLKKKSLILKTDDVQSDQNSEYFYFLPWLLNEKNQIIMQIVNNQYLLMKKNNLDKLVLMQNPINCSSKSNYRNLSSNGPIFIHPNKRGITFYKIYKMNK